MSDNVSLYVAKSRLNICLEQSEKIGKRLYEQNENYRNIANCMEHPEFRKLFDKHFSNWDDIRNILMFLKLYNEIHNSSSINLNGYQILSILDNIMKDSNLRHKICKQVIRKNKDVNLIYN